MWSPRAGIDRELQRFQAIQLYVQRAVLVQSLTGLHVLTLEAIVEAFEFEVALFLTWDGKLSVAHAFGFETRPAAATLPFEEGWVADGTSRILEGDNPVLGAWAALGLRDAILAPLPTRTVRSQASSSVAERWRAASSMTRSAPSNARHSRSWLVRPRPCSEISRWRPKSVSTIGD